MIVITNHYHLTNKHKFLCKNPCKNLYMLQSKCPHMSFDIHKNKHVHNYLHIRQSTPNHILFQLLRMLRWQLAVCWLT